MMIVYLDSMFSIIPLGSSGLLISWDPHNFTKDLADNTKILAFRFESVIKGQENKSLPLVTSRRIDRGQVIIKRLSENTTYHVTIMTYVINR